MPVKLVLNIETEHEDRDSAEKFATAVEAMAKCQSQHGSVTEVQDRAITRESGKMVIPIKF
jgi:hypothetical protein